MQYIIKSFDIEQKARRLHAVNLMCNLLALTVDLESVGYLNPACDNGINVLFF